MISLALAGCLGLLAYLVGVALGSIVALVLLAAGCDAADPATRARRLFAARLAPAALGLFFAFGLVLPSFLWLEPARTEERVGSSLALAAAVSGAILLVGLTRGALALLETRRLVGRWERSASRVTLPGVGIPSFAVDEPFPLVAIAGSFRPRLYVSRAVLRHCTSAELEAIVAHEAGHLRRGDVWKRLLVSACPDLFAVSPLRGELERRWVEATEQAADDHAAAGGGTRSLDLASALIRVARLAMASHPPAASLATLYRGGGVAGRVSRLLERRPSASVEGAGRPGFGVVAWGGTLLLLSVSIAALLEPIHRVLENVVRLLS